MSSLPAPVSDDKHVVGETAPAEITPRPVKGYRLPGEGSSTAISVVSVISLFALWWIATHFGWIRDLFLPTPERIITSFADAWKGDIQGGKPLAEHFWWSLYRVFAAFILACLTAIPVGIAMGVSRIARGIFDPPIEFYRPLPPLVSAEMVAATAGLGQMVLNASNFLRTDVVIMGIVVIGAVAYLFDLLMRRIERKLVPWKGQG